jgi:hypothetical protein
VNIERRNAARLGPEIEPRHPSITIAPSKLVMDSALDLEGLDELASGLFLKSVDELLALARDKVEAARARAIVGVDPAQLLRTLGAPPSAEPRLVAPPIPGPPLPDLDQLRSRPIRVTQLVLRHRRKKPHPCPTP